MNAVLKYPGSKWRTADWIRSYFPEHSCYLEPYFGSGAVFFGKEPSTYETVNDIDALVVNFFRACRDYPEELARAIYFTPYARDEYNAVEEIHGGEDIQLTGNCVEDARRFAVRCFQSTGSKLAYRSGWKNTKNRGKARGAVNPQVWGNLPDTILQVAERLKKAQIENTDAVELIEKCNAADCLIYADPPYLKETRTGGRIYRHEMLSTWEHERLLRALLNHKGRVVLSGYDNDLYNDTLAGWQKESMFTRDGSGNSRAETIWLNYESQIKMQE